MALFEVKGERPKMALLAVIDVGAEIGVARIPGIGEHGERLHSEIGVGLEPKTFDVLRELDAEIGPLEIGAADLLDMVGDALVLIGLAIASQTGKRSRFSTSKYLRVLLCNSRLPETPSSDGASKGRARMSSTESAGKQFGGSRSDRADRPVWRCRGSR